MQIRNMYQPCHGQRFYPSEDFGETVRRNHRRLPARTPRCVAMLLDDAGFERCVQTGERVIGVWENLTVVLEGEGVRLEPLAERHEAGLFEMAQDERVWSWMPYDASTSREVFHRWMEEAMSRSEAGVEAAFATIDAATGEPIGSTRYLALRPEHRGLEIGWTWLAPSHWRTGANVEAKLLMLKHAFEDLECLRVEFKTDSRNERSRNALAALPARFEGIFRKHMVVRGGDLRDSAYYSITDDEWPEVKKNLRRRLAAIHEEKETR